MLHSVLRGFEGTVGKRVSVGLLIVLGGLIPAPPVIGQSASTYQYVYDGRNQLARVVDSAGNVITYSYDEVGNILAVSRSTVGSLPRPTLTSASPNQLNQGEDVRLTINGTGLLGGGVSTTNPGIAVRSAFGSDTRLTATLTVAPTAPLGAATLTVTTIAGAASIPITVVGPRPRITSVTPTEGVSTGGTTVTISGQNLTNTTTVRFGTQPATNVTFLNATTLTARTPPGPSTDPPTKVDVVVNNSFGSDALVNGFSYFRGISYGDVVTGSLDVIGEEDRYAFSGAVGERVYLRLTSAFLPRVRVLRPDGTQLCATDNPGAGYLLLECVLDAAGPHNLVVTDRNISQVGAYTFTLNRLNPPTIGTPVTYGQTASGTHDPVAELDFHTFTGAVGERIRINVTSTFLPSVSIRRPDGTQLCAGDNGSAGSLQLDCTLNSAGGHSIIITDRNLSQTGTYSLTLTLIP